MQETTEQYTARISGYVAGKNHLKVLQESSRRIERALKGKPTSQLTKTPAGKWSIGEILAHLAESEIVIAFRLRLVLGSNGTQVQAFDQNKWQENAGYLKKDPRKSFELFRNLRETNVALLKSLKPEQWDCFGIHQERGRENITRMVELYAGHDVNHVRQIESISRTYGRGEKGKRRKD